MANNSGIPGESFFNGQKGGRKPGNNFERMNRIYDESVYL